MGCATWKQHPSIQTKDLHSEFTLKTLYFSFRHFLDATCNIQSLEMSPEFASWDWGVGKKGCAGEKLQHIQHFMTAELSSPCQVRGRWDHWALTQRDNKAKPLCRQRYAIKEWGCKIVVFSFATVTVYLLISQSVCLFSRLYPLYWTAE